MSYFDHAVTNGLGSTIDDILSHIRKEQKITDKQETAIAPYVQQMFALQTSSMQAQQQHSLQQTQLEQRGGQAEQLMTYLPYVLGGLGVLGVAVVMIRMRRKR